MPTLLNDTKGLDFSFDPICAMHETPWIARDSSEIYRASGHRAQLDFQDEKRCV